VSDERDDDLRALLLGLPERQRLAVFLRYYADLPYEEIAEALDISPGTVAASLNAARRALRRTYEEVNK
jgi:RNA polymerase sigma-70 factor (ECF subfamily)